MILGALASQCPAETQNKRLIIMEGRRDAFQSSET